MVRFPALATRLAPCYNNYSYKQQMETWSNFSGSDLGVAVIGLAGLVSVWVVLSTAFGNVTKRELNLRNNARPQSDASDQ